jgi:hypothetical protein
VGSIKLKHHMPLLAVLKRFMIKVLSKLIRLMDLEFDA